MSNSTETNSTETNSTETNSTETEPDAAEPTKLCYLGSGGAKKGQVCFEIVDTATATIVDSGGNVTTKDVNVTLDFVGGTGIKVSYSRFEGNLTHDPSFGYAVEQEEKLGFFASLFSAIWSFFSSLFFFL
jgi:hypothetical protein